LDGPARLHDAWRVDKKGQPTYAKVMAGLRVLQKHRVEFNTLTVVNRLNARAPLEVYRFLREIGSGFIQFIPLVERKPDDEAQKLGLDLSTPPQGEGAAASRRVTDWSLEPRQYGHFLSAIFDEWVRRDVGRVFVQMFDVALGNWMGLGSSLCVFQENCGAGLALEHNGDVYSCDHYVYPRYQLGNVLNQTLGDMARSETQQSFGQAKSATLPQYCRDCDVRFACHGECPKHRFLDTPTGEPGLNYLCQSYQHFFRHIDPAMKTMAALVQAGRPAAEIMRLRGSG
jgi:uncharacterized protein